MLQVSIVPDRTTFGFGNCNLRWPSVDVTAVHVAVGTSTCGHADNELGAAPVLPEVSPAARSRRFGAQATIRKNRRIEAGSDGRRSMAMGARSHSSRNQGYAHRAGRANHLLQLRSIHTFFFDLRRG